IEAIIVAAPENLAGAVAAVRDALGDCRQAVAQIRSHPDDAPSHGRRLLDLTADTLSAALLLEEAAADIVDRDARKAGVADRYIAGGLRPRVRRGLAPMDDPAHRHFDAIIRYEDVPVVALPGQRPPV